MLDQTNDKDSYRPLMNKAMWLAAVIIVLCFILLERNMASNVALVVVPVVIIYDHLNVNFRDKQRSALFASSAVMVYLAYFAAFPGFVPDRVFEFIPVSVGLGLAILSVNWIIAKVFIRSS